MKPRHKKFALIISGVIGLALAGLFIANAFQSNLVFYHSPTDVLANKVPLDKTFRLGGMVKKGTVKKSKDGLEVSFVITDFAKDISVHYKGILPDLFREGQGVIAQGRLAKLGDTFEAKEVLAKHDEKYMPPEVAKTLEQGKAAAEAAKNKK